MIMQLCVTQRGLGKGSTEKTNPGPALLSSISCWPSGLIAPGMRVGIEGQGMVEVGSRFSLRSSKG